MKKIIPIIFLLFISLFSIKALFHPGFYTSHDGEHQVIRLYRYYESLKDGQIPPRWAKDLDNGYGYPLFIFTYQTPWFIGVPLLKLGFSLTDSIKGVFIIGYLLSGLFMYLWLKKKTGILGGFLGAFLYIWAPYRFSNIFVRASLGEATVFIFLPLLFWGIEKSAENKNYLWGIILTAIGLSGIILSHLMGLIIFALPILLWIVINIFHISSCHSGEGRNLFNNIKINTKAFKNIIFGLFLGVSLSSYYLFPAILEKGFTNANETLVSLYKDHFVTLSQLLYSKWDYGFDFPGTINDAMSFQLGIAQWLIMGISSIMLILSLRGSPPAGGIPLRRDNLLIFLILTFIYSIFMMLPISASFWQLIVKYSYFDFPWRFLGLTVFITAVSGAYLVSTINKLFCRDAKYCVSTIFVILIIIITLYANRNHLRVNQYVYHPDSFYIENTNTTNQYDEYRPKTLNNDYVKKERPKLEYNQKNITIKSASFQSNSFMIEGNAIKYERIKINLAYFPGWEIYLNGKKQENIMDKEGVMSVNIYDKNFYITGVFNNTPVCNVSNIISIIAVVLLILIFLKKANNFPLKIKIILPIFIIWKILLLFSFICSQLVIPLREGYLGGGKDVNIYLSNPFIYAWANMDGAHYVSIARYGYMQFEQAFFPLYPLLLRYFNKFMNLYSFIGAQLLSNLFFIGAIIIFFILIKNKFSQKPAIWTLIFLLSFPTSFFFNAAYTESLFLLLVLLSFYFSEKQKWFLAGIIGALASATRLAGIFLLPALLIEWWLLNKKDINSQPVTRNRSTLKPVICICLIPLGLFAYMYYLYITVHDPLYFFHVQPLFGANRSGGMIILLPQVIFRYFKIFFTASISYDYIIALIEFISFFLAAFLLLRNFRKIPLSWQIFSWLSLLVPPLTGSFSSIPRYILTIFPLYYLLSLQSKMIRYILLVIFLILQMVLTGFYLRGYFVA